jgi:DivIVA domain-containing protein
MELTPNGLRDIVFSERWRGYDPQQVDEFCDQVAQLIDVLQRLTNGFDLQPAREQRRAA